jgi:hypothetical protein
MYKVVTDFSAIDANRALTFALLKKKVRYKRAKNIKILTSLYILKLIHKFDSINLANSEFKNSVNKTQINESKAQIVRLKPTYLRLLFNGLLNPSKTFKAKFFKFNNRLSEIV